MYNIESESPDSKYPVHSEVHELLIVGIRNRAFMRMNWFPKVGLEEKERRWSIVIGYFYTPKALQDVGNIYGMTREGVRQSIKDTLWLLYRAIPEKDRKNLTLPDQITLRKPLSIKDRERVHGKKGYTVSISVANALAKLGPDYPAIRAGTGLSAEKLAIARASLASWGIESVPRRSQYYVSHAKLAEDLKDTNKSDEEIRQQLTRIRGGFIRDFVDLEGGPIVSAKKIIEEAGYHCRADKRSIFVEVLRQAGIPLVSVPASKGSKNQVRHYHVIAAQHLQRAVRALRTEASLDKFRRKPI